ncbi:MAG: SIS domain-containing protein [bacterium]|nr:SIS domain-containing protein [bacterium]
MAMDQAIKDFPQQFTFTPEIVGTVRKHRAFVVAGMGGSALAVGLLRLWKPELDMVTHRDYGLPSCTDLSERLFIASSYSGNTEETLDALAAARARGLDVAVVATGGELLTVAQAEGLPYVQMPATGIQPRTALGYSTLALLALVDPDGVPELQHVELATDASASRGKVLAGQLAGRVPVVYASTRNRAIAYNWKIKLNETGKIPAFMNVFPELNHNEMNGFEAMPATRTRTSMFHGIFLHDDRDDERTRRRMEVCATMYRDRGVPVEVVQLEGAGTWARVWNSLLTADWMAYHTAIANGADPERVPMVEEFKQLMV